jgi:CDP-diacylglycerol--glycerol-3-phosphate 3-phosphatidyltransferase
MKTKLLLNVPYLLTYSRLLMAVVYIFASLYKPAQQPLFVGLILIYAILSDIFDGVIARRLKIATDHLRQLDSKVDTVFWFSLLYLLIVMRPEFMKDHALPLFILLVLEIGVQLFGFFKFNTAMALHTYAAKAWAVLLTLTVLQLLWTGDAAVLFTIMFAWGLISQTEVILILLKLKTYRVDIKSILVLK